MFDVITNLKGLQGRFPRPAATCDPSAWRDRRQETPWFHRGLGSPPPPSVCSCGLTSAEKLTRLLGT